MLILLIMLSSDLEPTQFISHMILILLNTYIVLQLTIKAKPLLLTVPVYLYLITLADVLQMGTKYSWHSHAK